MSSGYGGNDRFGGEVSPPEQALRLVFWRRTRALTLGLLVVWGVVTFGVCWYARELNRWQLGSFPLGFWMSAQGAIVVYVGLIIVYAWVMERWEGALRQATKALVSEATHG